MSTDGAVAYGIEEIRSSAEEGAVDCLVIDASLIRDPSHKDRWSGIVRLVGENGERLSKHPLIMMQANNCWVWQSHRIAEMEVVEWSRLG